MNRLFLALAVIWAATAALSGPMAAPAAADTVELPKALQGLSIGGVYFMDYSVGKKNDQSYNQFSLNRGYLDVQKKVSSYLTGRYTLDLTRSGGDWIIRTKYLYGKFTFNSGSTLTQSSIEFGQGHAPYHDFWESINGYRVQGTMFLERNGVMSSADIGVVYGANLGGEVDDTFKKTVNSHYAGKYGSVQVGVYNGGGYHATENNENKVPEARVTLRPLPMQAPGLQVSVFGVDGKGNVAPTPGMPLPDFKVLNLMASYQTAHVTLTGEGYTGTGNQGGSTTADQNGYSFFGRVKIPQHEAWEIIARYDHFDGNIHVDTNDEPDRLIGGVSYTMSPGCLWLASIERLNHSTDGTPDDTQGDLSLQIKF